ncbi:MAG TPA: ABC transporter permease [Bacteroidetes bacterium]|nr:ABC transporter permease [Bacteroidota bacterium]
MFKNLVITAFRHIRKHAAYSLVILIGLMLGISSSLFLLLYVFDDLSYDQFHAKKERIYRVVSHIRETDDDFLWAVAQIPFATQVKQEYPEVEEAVRIFPAGRLLMTYGGESEYEEDLFYADSCIFDVFSFELVRGDPASVLTHPNSLVVTRSLAKKYFGAEDPVGKVLVDGHGRSFEVTGLMEDVPRNSHIRFSGLISRTTHPPDDEIGSWGNFGVYTYLLLRDGTDYKAFDEKLTGINRKYVDPIFEQFGITIDYILQPLTSIYLHSDAEGESGQTGDIRYIYIFSMVAFFMLLIASMNYMNLSTARSTRRSREVGMRKVLGSARSSLVVQFLTESVMMTLLALVVSVLLVIMLFPSFNQLTGKSFNPAFLVRASVLLSLLGIVVFVGVLGGSYPALYLSRFKPLVVLRQDTGSGRSGFMVRKILVVLQFAISLALIVSTWVVYRQLTYLKGIDPGFDKENVVIVELENRRMMQQYPVLREKLMAIPGVVRVSSSNAQIGQGSGKLLMQVETPEGMVERGVNLATVDFDFVETMGIQILEGRDFSREFMSDTTDGVIINETMARRFNWEEPLGKKIAIQGSDNPPARVIGVMKDFYQKGLYNPIETFMLVLRPNGYYANIRIDGRNREEVLEQIRQAWQEMYPDRPFEYTFLADNFDEQFRADEKRAQIFTLFSLLIILIASIGLFGLASFTVEQRTREIGIRKVMGASSSVIVRLIVKEFLWLILISMAIGFPVAWYFMGRWLENYAYPTDLSPWIFAGTAGLALVVTALTVGNSTLRAAHTNPANVLRME